MGKLSFRYMVKPEPGHVNAFRYQYGNLTEYRLAYQRYAALSDASIFHSPVGITKIAAGLSSLRDLFVEPIHYGNTDYEDEFARSRHSFVPTNHGTIDVHKKTKDTIEQYGDFIHVTNRDMNIYQKLIYGQNVDGFNFSILPMYFMTGYTNDFEIRSDRFASGETNHFNILPILKPGVTHHNEMDILDQYSVQTFDNEASYYETLVLQRPDIYHLNWYEQVIAKGPDIVLNHFENLFGYIPDPAMNIIYQIYARKDRNDVILNDSFRDEVWKETCRVVVSDMDGIPSEDIIVNYPYRDISIRIPKYGNVSDMVSANKGINIGNINEIYNTSVPMPYLNVQETLFGWQGDKHGLVNEWLNAPANTKIAYDMDGMFYNVVSDGKTGYYFNPDTFGIQETKYSIVFEDELGRQDNNIGFVSDEVVSGLNFNKHGQTFNLDKLDSCINDKKMSSIYEIENTSKKKLHGFEADTDAFINKYPHDLLTIRENVFGNTNRNKKLHNMSSGVHVLKDKMMLGYIQSGIFGCKLPHGLFASDVGVHAYKIPKDLFGDTCGVFSAKKPRDINILEQQEHIFKLPKDLYLKLDEYFLYKLPKDLMECKPQEFAYKVSKLLNDPINGIWTSRKKILVDVAQQGEFVFKKIKHVQVADMIIPFSKINKEIFIDKIDETLSKIIKDGNWAIDKDMWASVIPKPIWYEESQLWMDKSQFQCFIDYENSWLIKEKIKGCIHDSLNSGVKNGKLADTFEDEWTSKSAKLGEVFDPPFSAIKYPKLIDVFEDEWIAKEISGGVHLFEDEWLKKIPSLLYYSYGLWADGKQRKIDIHEDESAIKKSYNMYLDFSSPAIRDPGIRIWFDEFVFTQRAVKEIDIAKHIEWLEKTMKKLMLHPNDVGNWAWVYETPDPLDPVFGIDELLLPENDTKYENFKEIIFDAEKMRPRNPVKEIDDTTFIAKYPIRHPSRDHFSDLAINYEASAYKWENYYGIKTEIMHICFLKYYRIWETKMFEFSTMTMEQSVNQMLEYMYAWMIDYFPLEELEEAFRVLRLIRWYGETAIIQNSQYIISYEYGILESKLTSGKCLVPCDLHQDIDDGKTNDTMYVDSSLGVIRNNPVYIGNGPAYVEFYIDNKKNTTFTFSLSNTVGSVNIYINDTLVDQKSFSALNLMYDLPAIDDTNVIRIEKPAGHNLNNMFYIGNIKIPNCSFKDLSIQFDPQMRAGNKPLDVVAKKMVKFAQLHENRDEVYDMIFKANLGINEVYKKLLEYWELHHADKVKGKRLTIKKC